MSKNPFDFSKHPNVWEAYDYAEKVISGEIPNCIYVVGAAKRFLRDLEENELFYFDVKKAERYLKLVQKFHHVKGKWSPPEIIYMPWQKFVWANIMGFVDKRTKERRFRTAHIEVPRGNGKAHPLDTLVPTPQGFKKWQDIEVGSELYSRDGSICRVTGKTPVEIFRAYKVVFSDGSEVTCSSGHEWVTSDKKEKSRESRHLKNIPKRKDALAVYESSKETLEILSTLKYGEEFQHSVINTQALLGRGRLDDINPYYLGAWLGDGSSDATSITTSEQDVDEMVSLLEERGVSVPTRGYRLGSYRLNVQDTYLKLKALNLVKNKHFKDEWLTVCYEDRLELLRGLLDTDGTIDHQGIVEFYNNNYSIADGVRKLACSFGFKATLAEKKLSENNNFKSDKTHYRVAFSPRGDVRLFNFKRKYSRQIESRGKHTYATQRYIKDVVDTGEDLEMFCVEVDSKDHTYLVGESYIPTHNSPMAGQAVLYFLALDNPVGNEISCIASKTDQAKIVLNNARNMAKKSQEYLAATNVDVREHTILHEQSNSIARALSSDDKSLDGLTDILAVLDELHAVPRDLYEVVSSGMSKRNDSLTLCITTAGFNKDNSGYTQSEFAKKVSLGQVVDETFFAVIWTIDDGDDVYSEETHKKANPCYGVSVDPITLSAKFNKAKISPADLPGLLVKNLNVWLNQAKSYFDMQKLQACADKTLKLEDFKGKKCFGGIDLATVDDLCTRAFCFRENGIYTVFTRTYIAEEAVKKHKRDIYAKAAAEGNLIIVPGEVVDLDNFQNDALAEFKAHKVGQVLYDPYQATSMAQFFQKNRIEMVEFRQTLTNFNEPLKKLYSLILEGKFRYNGSCLTEWCFSNVTVKPDAAGNVRPLKENEIKKIDEVIAIVQALAPWLQEKEDSVYKERGIRFI